MDKKLLLSFEEYSAIVHEHPYFYSIKSDEQVNTQKIFLILNLRYWMKSGRIF